MLSGTPAIRLKVEVYVIILWSIHSDTNLFHIRSVSYPICEGGPVSSGRHPL